MTEESTPANGSARIVRTLDEAGVPYRMHEHPALLTEADWRTSSFPIEASLKTWAGVLPDGTLVLAGLNGPAKLAYGALARAVGVSRSQLRPASPDDLARIGMAPGGVSPVTDDPAARVVIDEALPSTGGLFCGGGGPEATLEITLDDLLRAVPNAIRAPLSAG